MSRGTCRVEKADPSLFFPEQGVKVAEAIYYCARCPVRQRCLDYGKATKSIGVFGGEQLGLSFRDEVTLTPVALLTDLRPVEHLENPPEIRSHQNLTDFI